MPWPARRKWKPNVCGLDPALASVPPLDRNRAPSLAGGVPGPCIERGARSPEEMRLLLPA